MEDLRSNIFKKVCKIIGNDGRIFYAKIILIDKEGNLVLNQVLCQMPTNKISSLTFKIESLFNKVGLMSDLEEFNKLYPFKIKSEKDWKEFLKDKFYINGIILKKSDFKQIFLLN